MVLGWGRKPSALRARAVAAHFGLPLLTLEDGFARSVGIGRDDPSLCLVLDDVGIYYDASAPSRLEALIAAPLTKDRRRRAEELTALWRAGRVSKYNQAREDLSGLPDTFVLVADQTAGDIAIAAGAAELASFPRMLEAALDEHPGVTVVLKIHPEVALGRKRGHFDLEKVRRLDRVVVLGREVHAAGLLERASAVYAVTSQMGFEGLLWGRPVRVFGMPFYAGWGLTDDALPAPSRRAPVELAALVVAALGEYPRYRDPETGLACPAEQVLSWLGLQRRMRQRFPARVYARGFSSWKRRLVPDFLQGSAVTFIKHAQTVPAGATVAVWGRHDPTIGAPGRVLRLEDGFLRSVGLGVDLTRPVSWVVDGEGLYYDATRSSGLERLLAETDFSPELLARARELRRRIVAAGLTKYNVGVGDWNRPAGVSRAVLVPGQVESDASIALGCGGGVRTNLELLRAARECEPDAYLIYKPHPDVLTGIRKAGCGEELAHEICDSVVLHVPIHRLLDQVDAVHVLTSLAGFEALLREKPVFCHGQPFYAGWGLTVDAEKVPRRTRQLSLDELVAAALILYPTYLHPATGRFTTPEGALDALHVQTLQARGRGPSWRTRLLRPILAFLRADRLPVREKNI
jgi:capsular polysaccharide export protein